MNVVRYYGPRCEIRIHCIQTWARYIVSHCIQSQIHWAQQILYLIVSRTESDTLYLSVSTDTHHCISHLGQ